MLPYKLAMRQLGLSGLCVTTAIQAVNLRYARTNIQVDNQRAPLSATKQLLLKLFPRLFRDRGRQIKTAQIFP